MRQVLKKAISLFLIMCLMIPFAAQLPLAGAAETVAGYEVFTSVEYTKTSFPGSVGNMFYAPATFEAIDLTQYGYPAEGKIAAGKLGLQIDLYMDVSASLEKALAAGSGVTGQIEITSSGKCDVNEMIMGPTALKWKNEDWNRVVLDLASFTTTEGTFDPTNFNFFRIYMDAPNDGSNYFFKMYGIRVVDLTKPLDEEDALPLGDGMGKPDEPVFKVQTDAWDYNPETAVVAGYNLMEYAQVNRLLPVRDWAPIIQMLLFSLGENGGGTLYIPAGVYDCYSPISIPKGCVLQGDWVNPDDSITVEGTVIAVRTGKGTTAPAFVAMSGQGVVKSLAFWYPEQSVNDWQVYPTTIEMNHVDRVENVTLVNAYRGITSPYPISCPNIENVYGTPLNSGIEMLSCSDQWEMENVHFSPTYWINSGLDGAPATAAEKQELRDVLYYDATGITLGRIDWSWVTYSSVRGYSVGVHLTPYNGQRTNGMIHEMQFEDCYTAIQVDELLESGFIVTSTTIKDCLYGVFFADMSDLHVCSFKMMDMDISATEAAIVMNEMTQVSLGSSVIRKGAVEVSGGWLTVTDTTFLTAAPQVTLNKGAQAAAVAACQNSKGRPITVQNDAKCSLTVSEESVGMGDVPTIPAEKGGVSVDRAPASHAVTVLDTLDKKGNVDVSAALQAALNAQALTGGTVFLPPGQYRLDHAVTVPSGVLLLGAADIGQDISDYTLGTVFLVYHGKGTTAGATFILQEDAGLRGVKARYPEQTFANGEVIAYPYLVQGQGARAYVVNVSMLNAYGGVDFMTYRCDEHYIDAVRGAAFCNFLKIGGGAVGGIVRNCHQQFSSFATGDAKTQVMNYACLYEDFMIVGDVTDETLVGNFAYAAATGMRFVAEDSGAADVTVYAFAFDCVTVNLEVEDAERIDIVALQTTAFNFMAEGSVDPSVDKEENHVFLHDTFDGTVNVWTGILYENPDYVFRVEGGRLNMYSFIMRSSSPLNKAAGNGTIRLIDGAYTVYAGIGTPHIPAKLPLNSGKGENVEMWLGYYFRAQEGADELGRYEDLSLITTNWYFDQADNMTVAPDAEVLWSDAFTDYAKMLDSQKMQLQTTGGTVSYRRGMATLQHGANAIATMLSSKGVIELAGGADYVFEMRLKVNSLQAQSGNKVFLALYNEAESAREILRVQDNGALQVTCANGWQTIGTVATEQWYRLQVRLNMMTDGAYTCEVILCDDAYVPLASGGKQPLNLTAVCGFRIGVDGMPTGDQSKTELEMDYAAFMTACHATMGDVNGDGVIDSTDARLTLQYAVGKIAASALDVTAADVNGDGKADSTDARLILQYAVEKITTFPTAG